MFPSWSSLPFIDRLEVLSGLGWETLEEKLKGVTNHPVLREFEFEFGGQTPNSSEVLT